MASVEIAGGDISDASVQQGHGERKRFTVNFFTGGGEIHSLYICSLQNLIGCQLSGNRC